MARCHTDRETKGAGQCAVATARIPVVTNAVTLTVGLKGHTSIEEGTKPGDNQAVPRSADGQRALSRRPARVLVPARNDVHQRLSPGEPLRLGPQEREH